MVDVEGRVTEMGNLGKIKVFEDFFLMSEWTQGGLVLPLCEGLDGMLEAAGVTWCLWESAAESPNTSTMLSKIVVVSIILSVGWKTGTSSSDLDPVSLREAGPKDYKPFCPLRWLGRKIKIQRFYWISIWELIIKMAFDGWAVSHVGLANSILIRCLWARES